MLYYIIPVVVLKGNGAPTRLTRTLDETTDTGYVLVLAYSFLFASSPGLTVILGYVSYFRNRGQQSRRFQSRSSVCI